MNQSLFLRRVDDMHCHFRDTPLLDFVLPMTAKYCGRAIAMPNLRPRPILEAKDVLWYRKKIEDVLCNMSTRPDFEPLMTIEIRDSTTSQTIKSAKNCGAVAGKIYPLGVTTNSQEGLRDFFSEDIFETFRAMQDLGMMLLIHGELDMLKTLVTRREHAFLPTFVRLVEKFPKLKIVLEHVSTMDAVQLVASFGKNVAATITAHHLCTTLNDVIGDGTHPHNMCMPVPKGFIDQKALLEAATSGNSKFFLGSDSAPHAKETKECSHGKCGVFTAPLLPCLLAGVFEKVGKLDMLENFTSRFGAQFYGLPLNEGVIKLAREEWEIPAQYGSVVPFMAGKTLSWKLC